MINQILNGMMQYHSPSQYWSENQFCEEIEKLKIVYQRKNQTVYDHTMKVLDALSVKNPTTLLTALFHDSGKFATKNKNNFINHEIISADIAYQILTQWGTQKRIIDSVYKLILTHMLDLKSNIGKNKVKKFIASIGYDNIDNWFVVRRADIFSYSENHLSLLLVDNFEKKVKNQLEEMINKNKSMSDELKSCKSIEITGHNNG